MANRLVERLCQTFDSSDPEYFNGINIAYEPFVGVVGRVVSGRHTRAQAKNFYNMNAEDATGFDLLLDLIDGKAGVAEKLLGMHQFTAIMTFWEQRDIPGYQTPDDIQSELLGI